MTAGSHMDPCRRFLGRMREARARTDELFDLVRPEAMHDRPIPERHRILFYLGHFEGFEWNMIGRAAFGMEPFREELDRLFEFGIDPVEGDLLDDRPSDWPSLDEIHDYKGRVRQAVDRCVETAALDRPRHPYLEDGQIFHVVIEHRMMHAETLAYMLHWLPFDRKKAVPLSAMTETLPGLPRPIEIPPGPVTLGLSETDMDLFGWDNEFRSHQINVPAFTIDSLNVTNRGYLKFVESGGYLDNGLWDDLSWGWIQRAGIRQPQFWLRRGNDWFYRTMFADVPLPLEWPVYVSHAEATAYARWVRKALPTEAQWQRAAYCGPEGLEQQYPWGDAVPEPDCGNFDFRRWTPEPVGAFPQGKSPFGVSDLVGNGWEWTSTPFGPFPGFRPFEFYEGYSADFFDGRHFVLKGGSPRTARCMLRRSFRNWFQSHYPYPYATFRCVEN